MRICQQHPWPATSAEAIALQKQLAPQVVLEGDPAEAGVHTVAGCDLAFLDRGRKAALARAAVVLLSYPDLQPIEQRVVVSPVTFPYVPGLLAFREAPCLLRAFERLERVPDLLLVDGNGYAHPRRFGIACHLGILLDIPTIGCAKSRLIGRHDEPSPAAGSRAELCDGDELIGAVLRTRERVRPLYLSPGHRIGFGSAVEWVMRLSRGYRLPEPTRQADRLAGGEAP